MINLSLQLPGGLEFGMDSPNGEIYRYAWNKYQSLEDWDVATDQCPFGGVPFCAYPYRVVDDRRNPPVPPFAVIAAQNALELYTAVPAPGTPHMVTTAHQNDKGICSYMGFGVTQLGHQDHATHIAGPAGVVVKHHTAYDLKQLFEEDEDEGVLRERIVLMKIRGISQILCLGDDSTEAVAPGDWLEGVTGQWYVHPDNVNAHAHTGWIRSLETWAPGAQAAGLIYAEYNIFH